MIFFFITNLLNYTVVGPAPSPNMSSHKKLITLLISLELKVQVIGSQAHIDISIYATYTEVTHKMFTPHNNYYEEVYCNIPPIAVVCGNNESKHLHKVNPFSSVPDIKTKKYPPVFSCTSMEIHLHIPNHNTLSLSGTSSFSDECIQHAKGKVTSPKRSLAC